MIKENKQKTKQSLEASLLTNIELFLILVYWELLIYCQIHNSFKDVNIFSILFMLPISTVLTFLLGWFQSEKSYVANEVCKIVLLFLVSLFYISDWIYYCTFGSLVSVSMLGNGTNAVTNFWWSIVATLKENIVAIILLELPVLLEIILIFFRKVHKNYYSVANHFIKLIVGIALWFVVVLLLPITGTQDYTAYGAYHSSFVNTDTASAKIGTLPNFIVEVKYSLFGSSDNGNSYRTTESVNMDGDTKDSTQEIVYNEYENIDFTALKDKTDDETLASLCDYLGTQTATSQNEYTGLFKGYNLIYICAESFSSSAIDKTVTPTLYKLANNGIVLNNYYNSFKNTTTNGEFALLTGLWPNVVRENTNGGNLTGTMGQSIGKNMSTALGNMMNNNEGISSRGYHDYYGYYYGRNETLPNMGFTCKFMGDGMEFTTSWPASDYEMMVQSIDDYINDDQFCTYYMTFSGHGNYTTDNVIVAQNIDEVSSMLNGRYLSESALGYLSGTYELEKAMAYLVQRLEEAGKLDNTVIVLTGDHYPYYLTDYGYCTLNNLNDESEIDYDFGMYKSTCIIYNAGLEKNIYVDEPCCNIDILPTILNLFDIKYDSRLYAGTDIFSDGDHIAQLYNMSFITDYVKYNSTNGEAEWLINTDDYDQATLDAYLENMINTVKNKYMMSIEIEESDFYEFLFENYKQLTNFDYPEFTTETDEELENESDIEN